MLRLSGVHRLEPGAKLLALIDWIRRNQCAAAMVGGARTGAPARDLKWSNRRVIVFTEYGDTKRHLEEVLGAAFRGTDRGAERILAFHGGLSDESRASIQKAFNSSPESHPVRVLLATDAAREGINLQAHCSDVVHFDVPWNPARMEQRNGRIDRTLQPAKEVRCHYFFYPQRPEDQVLKTLVRKVAQIEKELGALGDVLHEELASELQAHGLSRSAARAIERAALPADRAAAALAECEALRQRDRLKAQIDEAGQICESSRAALDFREEHLREAIEVGLELLGLPRLSPHASRPGTFHLPELPDTWVATVDTLRRPREADESFWDWRKTPPLPVTFSPMETLDGDVHHLHLQHPFVQRMLARFASAHDLARVTVVQSREDGIVRAIGFGRLSLFGAGAVRLHEELIAVAAPWLEARGPKHLRPFASEADRKALDRLETTLAAPRAGQVAASVKKRLVASAGEDFAVLWRHILDEAGSREQSARGKLLARGATEARELERLLRQQDAAIDKSLHRQMPLFVESEGIQRSQWKEDRKHLEARRDAIRKEIASEPAAIEASYEVVLRRVEPIGLIYLWPASK